MASSAGVSLSAACRCPASTSPSRASPSTAPSHLSSAASPCAAVVNVISAGAFLASPNTSMYAGAKAALLSFTRTMAAVFAPHGIRVNALAPGSVDTDMMRNNPPDAQARMAAASFQGRMADPDEMVGPALFLASDAASFVTGQVLIADGGLVQR